MRQIGIAEYKTQECDCFFHALIISRRIRSVNIQSIITYCNAIAGIVITFLLVLLAIGAILYSHLKEKGIVKFKSKMK